MSEGLPPEPPTPPAFVRRLAGRVDDQHASHTSLREIVHANHLAVLHQIGQLAEAHLRIEELLRKLVERGIK